VSAKQPLPNQHDLLHPFYGPENCCLCKAQADLAAEVTRRREAEEKLAEARLEHESSEAVLHMTVSRLGGTVEGRPTLRLNFLQRIDELCQIERHVTTLSAALERYGRHESGCDMSEPDDESYTRVFVEAPICTCGLSAALAGSEVGKAPDVWVSVADRLPPPKEDVLVRTITGRMSVAYRCAGRTSRARNSSVSRRPRVG
jgi:hypothetical protein